MTHGDLGVIGQHELGLNSIGVAVKGIQRLPASHYSGAPFVGETLEEVKLDPRWEYRSNEEI